jgi:prepilin-type N-terminal cleavage/methylation domain-containing protein
MKMNSTMKYYNKGFGLLEVLIALVIFGSAMLIAAGVMVRSVRISIDNEISSRAQTMAVRVLELAKKPDGIVNQCSTGDPLTLTTGSYYAVGDIDLSATNVETCVERTNVTALITDCGAASSEFKTSIILPQGSNYRQYNEDYCVQLFVEDIAASEFDKVKVRVIYTDLTDEEVIYDLEGLRVNR